jgi:alkylhydroperoxidase family enzyme
MRSEEINGILDLEKRYYNEREYKVVQYAIKSAREAHRITDKDWEELRELGYSNLELLEIQETISSAVYFANFSDSLNNRLTWWQIMEDPGHSK